MHVRFVCACAVHCVSICSGREDEGGGVWSVGQGGRGDSQLKGFVAAAMEMHKINKTPPLGYQQPPTLHSPSFSLPLLEEMDAHESFILAVFSLLIESAPCSCLHEASRAS